MTKKRGDKKVAPVPLSEVVPTAEEVEIFTPDFLKKSVDQAVRSVTKGASLSASKKRGPA